MSNFANRPAANEAGEQYAELARKAGNALLDSYEQALQRSIAVARTLIS